jgi:hypothetical protein
MRKTAQQAGATRAHGAIIGVLTAVAVAIAAYGLFLLVAGLRH